MDLGLAQDNLKQRVGKYKGGYYLVNDWVTEEIELYGDSFPYTTITVTRTTSRKNREGQFIGSMITSGTLISLRGVSLKMVIVDSKQITKETPAFSSDETTYLFDIPIRGNSVNTREILDTLSTMDTFMMITPYGEIPLIKVD